VRGSKKGEWISTTAPRTTTITATAPRTTAKQSSVSTLKKKRFELLIRVRFRLVERELACKG
jgi:hypothetical protein